MAIGKLRPVDIADTHYLRNNLWLEAVDTHCNSEWIGYMPHQSNSRHKHGSLKLLEHSTQDITMENDKLTQIFLSSGRFLFAITMVLFGIDHFIYASFVATIVPPWIPWHLFWTYFVGVALIGAGLGILFKKHAQFSATLLGGMIFLFVLLIHLRLLANRPEDMFATRSMFGDFPGRLINCMKDLGLSGAAFIFAGMQSKSWRVLGTDKLLTLGRCIFSLSIATFGVLHFLYPAFAPGIPPMYSAVSFCVPGHAFWVYLTGAALLAAGISIAINYQTHLVATLLGAMILLFLVTTWVPVMIAHPADIIAGNWLKDFGLAGGALMLSEALSEKFDKKEAEFPLLILQ